MTRSPDRALVLAVRTARLLGLLMVILGAFWLLPILFTRPTGRPQFRIIQVLGATIPLVPGIGYLLLSIALHRRQMWAAVSTIVLAGIQGAFLFYAAASLAYAVFTRENPRYLNFVLIVLLLLAAAVGQLIYFAARALPAIRNPPIEQSRGFELVTKDASRS